MFEALSELGNKKLKICNILIEKCKNMIEYPDFEPKCYSRTAKGINKTGHDSKRILNWMAYYERDSEKINLFDLMTSVLTCLNEISQR